MGPEVDPQRAAEPDLTAGGAVGEVRSVHATMAKAFLDPDDIRNDAAAAGGGSLRDMGPASSELAFFEMIKRNERYVLSRSRYSSNAGLRPRRSDGATG